MPDSAPACPRCAYDLSGLVESWTGSCPLEGVCSECGLQVEWRNVLNWSLTVPRWSFEHTRRVSVRAWLGTGRRALNPIRFWRQVRLEHPVKVPRLIASIAAALLLVHLCIAVATACCVYDAAAHATVFTPAMVTVGGVVRPATRMPRPSSSSVWSDFGASIAEAAAWPYRPWFEQMNRGGARWASYSTPSLVGLWTVFIAAFWATVAPGFLVLGETLRRCKVRPVHLVRGLAYSLVGPAAAVVGAVGYAVIGLAIGGAGPRAVIGLNTVRTGAVCAGCLWLGVYWIVFVVRYLRLTHAAWVAASMLVIGGLCATLATTLAWLASMGKLW